jgi:hypothetical protein
VKTQHDTEAQRRPVTLFYAAMWLLCWSMVVAPFAHFALKAVHEHHSNAEFDQLYAQAKSQERTERETQQCILGIRAGYTIKDVLACTPAAVEGMKQLADHYYGEPGHYPWLTKR